MLESSIHIEVGQNNEVVEAFAKKPYSAEATRFLSNLIGFPVKSLLAKEFWSRLSSLNYAEFEYDLFLWVNSYFFSEVEFDNIHNEKVLCRCVSYLEEHFINFLKENPTIKVSEIAKEIQVGAGCGSCFEDVHRIYESVNYNILTPFQVSLKVQEIIDQRNGSKIKVVGASGKKVFLQPTTKEDLNYLLSKINNKFPRFDFVIVP